MHGSLHFAFFSKFIIIITSIIGKPLSGECLTYTESRIDFWFLCENDENFWFCIKLWICMGRFTIFFSSWDNFFDLSIRDVFVVEYDVACTLLSWLLSYILSAISDNFSNSNSSRSDASICVVCGCSLSTHIFSTLCWIWYCLLVKPAFSLVAVKVSCVQV